MKEGNKAKVLFVGAFKTAKEAGHAGGQMYACTSLIQSDIRKQFSFVLLDSTATTNLKRPLYNRLYFAILRVVKFLWLLLLKRIDIVLAFSSYGAGFLEKGGMIVLGKWMGKRTVLAPRSGFLLDHLEASNTFRKAASYILKHCDVIVCQGQFWKEYFNERMGVPKDRLEVIHNWIDISQYDNSPKKNDTTLRVLFLGWVEENKGIFDLIQVIYSLKDKNIHWSIAGEGKDFEMVKQSLYQTMQEQKVALLGWVTGEQKRRLLHESDVIVIPSYREGLPNALLEGIASRCGVIATDVGAIPDVIEDGVNGFLIEPGDRNGLKESLLRYYRDRHLLKKHIELSFMKLQKNHSLKGAEIKFSKILQV